MMRHSLSVCTKILCASALLACLSFAGCASSNDGDVVNPATGGLQGTWEYLVTNAHGATFTSCTGDAAILEGATLFEGLSLAPICMTPVTLALTQSGDAFGVPSHPVICSDGATAVVSGIGQVDAPDLGGQWESQSAMGVESTQVFTGVLAGNTISLTETHRSFEGAFEGGCDFTPPLTAIMTIQ